VRLWLAACIIGSLSLMSACAPFDQIPECIDASTSDFFRFDPYTSEHPALEDERRTPGHFTSWEVGEVTFQPKGSEARGFSLLVEGEGNLPDLLALELPSKPAIETRGFSPPSGDPAAPVLRFGGEEGDLQLLAGNGELLDPIDGWSVRSPRDTDTCKPSGPWKSLVRVKPVLVTRGDEEQRLFPGQSAFFGDYEVTIVSAQSNNREHPWAPCASEACPWEKLAWWIARTGSTLLESRD
jgi:hypothetical protein